MFSELCVLYCVPLQEQIFIDGHEVYVENLGETLNLRNFMMFSKHQWSPTITSSEQ